MKVAVILMQLIGHQGHVAWPRSYPVASRAVRWVMVSVSFGGWTSMLKAGMAHGQTLWRLGNQEAPTGTKESQATLRRIKNQTLVQV